MNGPVLTDAVYAELVWTAIDRLPTCLLVVDERRRVRHVNQAAANLLCQDWKQLLAMDLDRGLMALGRECAEQVLSRIDAVLRWDGASGQCDEFVVETGRAHPAVLEVNVEAIQTHGPQVARGAVVTLRDITDQWSRTNELHYQATHDSLTGLINRYEFEQRLIEFMQHHERTSIKHALCFIDLNQFKSINDHYGHSTGDRLLTELSEYMLAHIRKGDVLARLGGDEFGLILGSCSGRDAVQVAEGIQRAVAGFRFAHGNETFAVTASIGVTDIGASAFSLRALIEAADIACYAAKQSALSGELVAVVHSDDRESIAARNMFKTNITPA